MEEFLVFVSLDVDVESHCGSCYTKKENGVIFGAERYGEMRGRFEYEIAIAIASILKKQKNTTATKANTYRRPYPMCTHAYTVKSRNSFLLPCPSSPA